MWQRRKRRQAGKTQQTSEWQRDWQNSTAQHNTTLSSHGLTTDHTHQRMGRCQHSIGYIQSIGHVMSAVSPSQCFATEEGTREPASRRFTASASLSHNTHNRYRTHTHSAAASYTTHNDNNTHHVTLILSTSLLVAALHST